jgi:hypothetical protein
MSNQKKRLYHMQCNTVLIKDYPSGYLTINESDYNPDVHTLYVALAIKPEQEDKPKKPVVKRAK